MSHKRHLTSSAVKRKLFCDEDVSDFEDGGNNTVPDGVDNIDSEASDISDQEYEPVSENDSSDSNDGDKVASGAPADLSESSDDELLSKLGTAPTTSGRGRGRGRGRGTSRGAGCVTTKKPKPIMKWTKKEYVAPNVEFSGSTRVFPDTLHTPYEYFKRFFTDDMFLFLARESLAYWHTIEQQKVQDVLTRNRSAEVTPSSSTASPKRSRISTPTTDQLAGMSTTSKPRKQKEKSRTFKNQNLDDIRLDLEKLVGVLIRMGIVKYANVFDYWKNDGRINFIADVLTRNRFWFLMRHLHFRANDLVSQEEKTTDRLWKLRLWINLVNGRFATIPSGEFLSVDEQMIKFKGHSIMRVYMPKKPTKWGFKVWALAGSNGFVYLFDIASGCQPIQKLQKVDLGASANVVLNMVSKLPENQNYKIYSDRYFNSVSLLQAMAEKGFPMVGTIQKNRIPSCPLTLEAPFCKKERGFSEQFVDEKSNLVLVQWLDSKPVVMLSSYVGIEPVGSCKRYDRKTKKQIEISCPAVIKHYNRFMGGVDLSDMLRSMYSFSVRCRRWYMYHFLYTLHMIGRNAWLVYKEDATHLGIKPMQLKDFLLKVANDLVKQDATVVCASAILSKNVRYDCVNHWPVFAEKRGRCKLCSFHLDRKTNFYCEKCKVHLCLTKDRNCFKNYHTL